MRGTAVAAALAGLAALAAPGVPGVPGVLGVARAEPPAEHELRTGGDLALAPGARGAASLTIVPAPNRRIDASAPLTVRLAVSPAKGVKLVRRRLTRDDAADPRAEAPRFDLEVQADPDASGPYTLTADVRFWVCGKKTCRPVRDRATLTIHVGTVLGNEDSPRPPPGRRANSNFPN